MALNEGVYDHMKTRLEEEKTEGYDVKGGRD